jgi:predicted enzyme related to lactoylglutathione lyase
MAKNSASPVVHLELHTGDLDAACAFYTRLFGWRAERIEHSAGTYQALELGGGRRNGSRIEGGVVECPTPRALWLPYVEVADLAATTERARSLGATVLLGPREGPAGWRSVVAAKAGAEVGLWQPKR